MNSYKWSHMAYMLWFLTVLSMFNVVIFTHVTPEVFLFVCFLFFSFLCSFPYVNILQFAYTFYHWWLFPIWCCDEWSCVEHYRIRPWLELVCHIVYLSFGEGNGTPLQYSSLEIPWTEEPGRLQSIGSWRVGHDWVTSLSLFPFMHWRRKLQPIPVFLPGESQGRGSLMGCRLWGCTESDTTEVT